MSGIAIIDSGVGGLSIYQEIEKKLPEQQYFFISDNQAFPYGSKPRDELKSRVLEIVERVIVQFDPKLIVIACNTASTVVLPLLRDHFSLPIVGVVPAIKPAAQSSKTKTIGLLATPATIKRPYTDELINKFAADCEVIRVGSSRLVEIAEEMLSGKGVKLAEIEQILQPLFEIESIDVIVLACTHFPLLNKEIKDVFKAKNHPVKLVDSGQGIANRVVQLVSNASHQVNLGSCSIAVFTEIETIAKQFEKRLNALGFDKLELLK